MTFIFYLGSQSSMSLNEFSDSFLFMMEEFDINWISNMDAMIAEGESCYFPGIPESSGSSTYYGNYGWYGSLTGFSLFEDVPFIICEGVVSGSFYTNIEANASVINGFNIGCDLIILDMATQYNCPDINTIVTNNSASPYGIYDMAGNTWEIIRNNNDQSLVKGGAFNSYSYELFSWNSLSHNSPSGEVGFRCLRRIDNE